ncbi:MAG: PilT/PilU family type 4a pilus ATPase, partial [Armatimonadota bacterium]
MEPSSIFNMDPLDDQESVRQVSAQDQPTPKSEPNTAASWGCSLEPLDKDATTEEGLLQTSASTSSAEAGSDVYDPLESDLDLTPWATEHSSLAEAPLPQPSDDPGSGENDLLSRGYSQDVSQDYDMLPLDGDLDMAPLIGEESVSRSAKSAEFVHIEEILREAVSRGSSDIHLSVNLPPTIRVDGRLVKLDYAVLQPEHIQRMLYDILSGEQIQWFEKQRELDMSYGVAGLGRFRVNIYRQRGSVGAAFRTVPCDIPSFDKLHLPPIVRELTHRHSGLILVTGPTGSGKSTTIASMIDFINSESPVHIMTIEDPIEYLHKHKKAMVNQRELNSDTDSFDNALRAVLREDPDVILVGEMRDLETISAAITLAETGHLVFGTLHTRSASQTIDRIVDVFPPHQQEQIR